MVLKRLTMTNFRGALSLPLELHDRLNVFVGVNGAGKSSIMDAAAVLLSWVVNRLKNITASGRPIAEKDITNGKPVAALEAVCIAENGTIAWKVAKTRSGYAATDERSNLTGLSDYIKRLQHLLEESNEQVNLPLLVYYPVNRAVLDIPLRIREKHRFNLLAAYDNSLTSGTDFRAFFEWFREREDLENENRKYARGFFKSDDIQYPDPQLEAVRKAVERFMPDFKNLSVRRNPLRMEVEKSGKTLTVNQLSDGEKCLMALVGDLARRIAIANPKRSNPLEGEGIVLIDEIDLHLHPKWQRMVVPMLIKTFPRCQFIISTHSPHVVTHVKPENLFLLRQTEAGIVAEKPSESYGKNVDRILEDLMGLETTRPDKVNSDLRRLYDQIDQGKISDAQQTIRELKTEIGDDPELVKAGVLIKRKELIKK